ncbi:hypothetical protein [Oryzobacter terrae]|uniref:hypothetical protein n=1 Tax=Oryzobacter terrae TaxID=1620385 RepID=UPI00366EDDB8
MTTNDSTQGPDDRTDDALAREVFDEPTTAVPTTAGTTWAPAPGGAAPGTTATATAVRPDQAPATSVQPPPREYVKGPAPFAIVLGLLGLVVAATTLFTEIVGIDVPWGDLGPWTVVGAGVLVLLVGGLGLRASRGQD